MMLFPRKQQAWILWKKIQAFFIDILWV